MKGAADRPGRSCSRAAGTEPRRAGKSSEEREAGSAGLPAAPSRRWEHRPSRGAESLVAPPGHAEPPLASARRAGPARLGLAIGSRSPAAPAAFKRPPGAEPPNQRPGGRGQRPEPRRRPLCAGAPGGIRVLWRRGRRARPRVGEGRRIVAAAEAPRNGRRAVWSRRPRAALGGGQADRGAARHRPQVGAEAPQPGHHRREDGPHRPSQAGAPWGRPRPGSGGPGQAGGPTGGALPGRVAGGQKGAPGRPWKPEGEGAGRSARPAQCCL